MNTPTKASRIAALNDALRKTFTSGTVVVTAGIQAFEELEQRQILEKVQSFEAFTQDNDPYGEHDFGAFDHNGTKIFWKIDCVLQKQKGEDSV